jgi:hypothetical protein
MSAAICTGWVPRCNSLGSLHPAMFEVCGGLGGSGACAASFSVLPQDRSRCTQRSYNTAASPDAQRSCYGRVGAQALRTIPRRSRAHSSWNHGVKVSGARFISRSSACGST